MTFASGCDKVPLLAPSGTVITLFPVANTVALNSEVEIVATVIEQGVDARSANDATGQRHADDATAAPTPGAGTPVQNGTWSRFTTTLGRVEPAEARTSNGQVQGQVHSPVLRAGPRPSRRSRAAPRDDREPPGRTAAVER